MLTCLHKGEHFSQGVQYASVRKLPAVCFATLSDVLLRKRLP